MKRSRSLIVAPLELANETLQVARQAMIDAFSELFPEVPIEVEGKVCSNWSEK